MCRHLAYLGPPVTLASLLYEPEHSLEHQAWAPREQRFGTVNADGWGVGWYDPAARPEPARYRTARPIWGDASFRSMAGILRSGCVVASVRSATPPSPVEESNTPPFASERWLFAHNGAVPGWRDGLGVALRNEVSDRRASGIEGATDSETLFAIALDRLDGGDDLSDAVAGVVGTVATYAGDARLNLLLADGRSVVATTWGDTLYAACRDGAVLLASEPLDPGDGWDRVPDRSLVTVDPTGLRVRPLDPPGPHP